MTARRTVEIDSVPADATPDTPAPARIGYGALLRTPGARTFLVPAFAARLPYAMLSLGIVLLVLETHGSYGTAGTVAAVSAVAQALVGPQTGRLADRYGQAAVLVPTVVVHAVSVAALIALALGHAPVWALLLAAAPAGASVPQIGAMVRSRWVAKLSAENAPAAKLNTAFAFESVTDEFTFVIGPVLAGAIATSVNPATGLIAEAALTVLGGLAFAAQRRTARPAPARARRPPGLRAGLARRPAAGRRVPRRRHRLRCDAGLGDGVHRVGRPAGCQRHGVRDLRGRLDAGRRALRHGRLAPGPRQRLLGCYALLVLGCSTLWAMPNLVALSVAALVCGLAIAPTLITGYTLVETLVADGAKTEAFTWLTGAIGLGLATGSTVAGQLIDGHGPSAGFLVPVAGAGVGLVALVALRHLLVAPGAASTVATGGERPAARQLVGAAKG